MAVPWWVFGDYGDVESVTFMTTLHIDGITVESLVPRNGLFHISMDFTEVERRYDVE